MEIWYTGVRKITKMNPLVIILLSCLHVFLLPITSIFYIIFPRSKVIYLSKNCFFFLNIKISIFKVGQYLSLPSIKFISHFVSYIVFVIFIIVSSFTRETLETQVSMLKNTKSPIFHHNETFVHYVSRSDLKIHLNFSDIFVRPTGTLYIDLLITVWVVGNFKTYLALNKKTHA